MELVDLTAKRNSLTEKERDTLIKALRDLIKDVKDGNVDGLVWVGVGGDEFYQGYYNCEEQLYPLIGGMDALKQYLLQVYHVNHFDEPD